MPLRSRVRLGRILVLADRHDTATACAVFGSAARLAVLAGATDISTTVYVGFGPVCHRVATGNTLAFETTATGAIRIDGALLTDITWCTAVSRAIAVGIARWTPTINVCFGSILHAIPAMVTP